uniref:Uncharacterized protein n=1 Tax=viral metagenome TaxID=1070528 RepID=A0A6M3LRA1_9ZZZZ
MILKVWDNGGKTMDRYTVRIRNEYYGMNEYPYSPQGFCQYVGSYGGVKEGRHLGRLLTRIEFKTLPADVRKAIVERT